MKIFDIVAPTPSLGRYLSFGRRDITTAVEHEFDVIDRIDGLFGVGSKSENLPGAFPKDALAARVLYQFNHQPPKELERITTFELWPNGDISGEREIRKQFSIEGITPGEHRIIFEGEYGLFVLVLGGYLGWGCGLGLAADLVPVVDEIWMTQSPTGNGVKVREVYAFYKDLEGPTRETARG